MRLEKMGKNLAIAVLGLLALLAVGIVLPPEVSSLLVTSALLMLSLWRLRDRTWLGYLCWALILAGLMVIVNIWFAIYLAMAWILYLVFVTLGELHRRPAGKAVGRSLGIGLLNVMVAAGVIAAAQAAPVKTSDRLMARPVTLAKESMTLGELDAMLAAHEARRVGFPVQVYLTVPPEEADRVVHWGRREMTLRQFVAAIEAQTPLRHQFGSCGNGWSSILLGGNCVFGLSFSAPSEPR